MCVDAFDIADGLEQVLALLLGESGCFPQESPDDLVRPEQHVQAAELAGLLQEADVRGAQVVESAGHNDCPHWLMPFIA